ncbi:hypothetical protein BGZ63DRAFT_459762 [Mariannaea sp. PMI_226]|nr:hypothetical protein BGZ63DRAFT_459762 [Mariannaea sp. PMI_226]
MAETSDGHVYRFYLLTTTGLQHVHDQGRVEFAVRCYRYYDQLSPPGIELDSDEMPAPPLPLQRALSAVNIVPIALDGENRGTDSPVGSIVIYITVFRVASAGLNLSVGFEESLQVRVPTKTVREKSPPPTSDRRDTFRRFAAEDRYVFGVPLEFNERWRCEIHRI